jgi:hypothetical protein
MFGSLEQEEERMDGPPPSSRERWVKFVAIAALTLVVFGGLYLALTLLEA